MESLLVEHLPRVLVKIVMEYARIKPTRFIAVNENQREFTITENGTRITRSAHINSACGGIGFVGKEPFHMSHKQWTCQLPRGEFWIGIADVLYLEDKRNASDVPNESCCYISKYGTIHYWGTLNHIQPIPIDTHITFTVDMERKTIKIILNGQEPLSWDARDLEHCRPYICLDPYSSNLSIDVQSQ